MPRKPPRVEADYWRPYCAPHNKRWLFYRRTRWEILSHPNMTPWAKTNEEAAHIAVPEFDLSWVSGAELALPHTGSGWVDAETICVGGVPGTERVFTRPQAGDWN